MRAVAYAPALAILAGCASATPTAVPPVVDIPALPPARPPRGPVAGAPPVPAPSASPQAPWTERIERTAKTRSVAACQIVPYTFSSIMVVENHTLDGGRLAVRVVQDDESGKGITAPPGLLGKGYVVEKRDGALQVHDASGAAVPDDATRRVQSLATAFLAWPGPDVASHLPAVGAEVPALAAPVIAIAGVPLHGDMVAQQSKATVRYAGPKKGDAGDELAFDVQLSASEGDAGMCHSWDNEAELKGELRMRAQGGALLGLHLRGTTHDTEGVCQSPSGGPPPPPHVCNRGEVTIEVRQPHVP
jgi:hypothetical protein